LVSAGFAFSTKRNRLQSGGVTSLFRTFRVCDGCVENVR